MGGVEVFSIAQKVFREVRPHFADAFDDALREFISAVKAVVRGVAAG